MGVLNTTPRTWVAGETVTAAEMNAEVRDAITTMEAAWTAYTPAWTGSTTNPVLNNGTLDARYNRVGKSIDLYIRIVMGSTTTYGTGSYSLALPATGNGTRWTFYADFFDSSASTTYLATGLVLSTGTASLFTAAGGGVVTAVTNIAPFTWAVGDQLVLNGRYEAA
jgi:hypothetical protein